MLSDNKKKFLAGGPYSVLDPELVAEETKARRLCQQLNTLDSTADAEKEVILKQLFGSVGKNPWIQPNFRCDFGYNIHVGDNFICNYDNIILDIAPVTMVNHVMLAPRVQIYSAFHPLDPKQRANFIGLGKPVTLGNDVWVGGGSVILPGVTLGNNVIVGANSTVTKSFGDNLIIAGSPAKVLRENPYKE